MNRTTKIIYYLCLFFAFSYVLIRGFTVGMTHDEALTYKIIQGDEVLKGTANHHWLNTHLSALSSHLFGAKEFALRLPNILSFGIFWFFLFRIAKTFLKSSATQLALLLLLCGNPFILDFFSLCRGYGLSIAFVTASLFYVFRMAALRKDSKPIHYFCGFIFAVLALSANLNTLNYFLIALALMVFSLLVFKPKNRIVLLAVLLFLSGIILYFSLNQLFFLRDKNELYFGTDNIHTTIDNLICSGFYSRFGFKHVDILRYLLYGLILLAGFRMVRKRLFFTPGTFAFIILIGIFTALIAEHLLFESLYPINRSSLYLYPVMLLAFLMNIEPLKFKVIRVLIIVCSVSFILVNIPFYNFKTTMTWSEDQDLKAAMLSIRDDIQDTSIHIAECTWLYEPVINYYRLEYEVPIQQVFREDIKFEGEYILFQTVLVQIKDYSILKDYSRNSSLVVYKRKLNAAN
ncbi:glycosyltransferase family 39 protein [uncultured Fluviicola sp.]|uniref:glycosyltransferase family 39 protein n=1 Tax=uncultured Fluviicola sp. TaxID=463303 RepID=UPI0025F014CC|nr:glycosyltransferase family 39 protein [uncultured Fluviicola sp.]